MYVYTAALILAYCKPFLKPALHVNTERASQAWQESGASQQGIRSQFPHLSVWEAVNYISNLHMELNSFTLSSVAYGQIWFISALSTKLASFCIKKK